MKLLALVLMMMSFNAFSEVKNVSLNSIDELSVTCPKGNVPELKGSNLKCVCPGNTYPVLEGKTLKCESVCVIAVETFKEDNCDQGGCWGSTSYEALVIRKNGSWLHEEKIYSKYSREIELLLPEMIKVAKQSCFKTFYNGKEI